MLGKELHQVERQACASSTHACLDMPVAHVVRRVAGTVEESGQSIDAATRATDDEGGIQATCDEWPGLGGFAFPLATQGQEVDDVCTVCGHGAA